MFPKILMSLPMRVAKMHLKAEKGTFSINSVYLWTEEGPRELEAVLYFSKEVWLIPN